MFTKDIGTLFIEVTPTRWNSYGPPTLLAKLLFKLLKAQGGVSNCTPVGWYDFNVKMRGLKLLMTLMPHKE